MTDAPSGPSSAARGFATSIKSSRRPAFAAAGLLLFAAGGWYIMSHGSAPKPKSAALQTPNLAPPAGGNNHSDKLDSATLQKKRPMPMLLRPMENLCECADNKQASWGR